MQNNTFEELDLSFEINKAVNKLGLVNPTSIQKQAIPPMMDGYDIIAKAPTGTGKTFAYGIPLLEYLRMDEKSVQNLILCPTRELALQICTELKSIGQYIEGLRVCAIIGGQRFDKQIKEIKENPQIVVATPGRLIDLINRKNINISSVSSVVLDEADEMLNMGFIGDIRKILNIVPKDRQLALFSATMSREVMDINWQYLSGAVQIDVAPKAEDMPKIKQIVVKIPEKDKVGIICKKIKEKSLSKSIVFCNTKACVRKVVEKLKTMNITVDCLHGDINQRLRNKIMEQYRNGKFSVLVATDIAARGIDVSDVEGVFNYDVPLDNEDYLHRIGRTGRAKKNGIAYTLVSFQEEAKMEQVIKYTKVEVEWE